MLPSFGLKRWPFHEGKISEPARWNLLGYQGGLNGKGAGTAHGVYKGFCPGISGKYQGRSGEGLSKGCLGCAGFDAPLVK